MPINFDKVKNYVSNFVFVNLPKGLYYHGIAHTLSDVLPAAEEISIKEGINYTDLLILKTAAVYHDIGYTKDYFNHEIEGAIIAEETLPLFGYNKAQIKQIKELILETKMPQNPTCLLSEILCDADLDSLGRSDFFILDQAYRLELSIFKGVLTPQREWFKRSLAFLESHNYFTKTAHELRDDCKRTNINEMKLLLNLSL